MCLRIVNFTVFISVEMSRDTNIKGHVRDQAAAADQETIEQELMKSPAESPLHDGSSDDSNNDGPDAGDGDVEMEDVNDTNGEVSLAGSFVSRMMKES